eukprot:gene8450-10380_t
MELPGSPILQEPVDTRNLKKIKLTTIEDQNEALIQSQDDPPSQFKIETDDNTNETKDHINDENPDDTPPPGDNGSIITTPSQFKIGMPKLMCFINDQITRNWIVGQSLSQTQIEQSLKLLIAIEESVLAKYLGNIGCSSSIGGDDHIGHRITKMNLKITEENAEIFHRLISKDSNPYMSSLNDVTLSYEFGAEDEGEGVAETVSQFIDKIRIPKGSFGESVEHLEILFDDEDDSIKNSPQRGILQSIIEVGSIPPSCKFLGIDHFLIEHNPLELIPPSVKDLLIYGWESREGDTYSVPPTVRELRLVPGTREDEDDPDFSDDEDDENTNNNSSSSSTTLKVCLPPSITLLEASSETMVKIPSSVKHLKFDFLNEAIPIGFIPSSVEKLDIDCFQKIVPGMIPNGVKDLEITMSETKSFKNIIPESVTILKINSAINIIDDKILPSGLTHLTTNQTIAFTPGLNHFKNLISLECQFDKPIGIGMLPPTLQKLNFWTVAKRSTRGMDICYIQEGSLPKDLEYLAMHYSSQTFEQGILPSNLKSLVIDISFYKMFPFDNCYIPPSVNQLVFEKRNPPIDRLEPFMARLFSNSKSILEIQVFITKFISFDSKDPYLYYRKSESEEGFILKSNLKNFLIAEKM